MNDRNCIIIAERMNTAVALGPAETKRSSLARIYYRAQCLVASASSLPSESGVDCLAHFSFFLSGASNTCVYIYQLHRLYGCLRLACGWILWHIRQVDDGRFRRHVCEALCVCYGLQALAVTRAQFTDRHTLLNWIAIVLLLALAIAYGSFRFGKKGNLIKVYELPTASALQ
jgi:hypothetical protein